MPPRISVIIPTYQRRASVEQAMAVLRTQTLQPDEYEVLVVIDGSNDGTTEMVSAFSAPYILRPLWQPNRGRAAACNTGIRAAAGEVIVLLDDDMDAAPQLLEAHWQAHCRSERSGVVGAAPLHYDASSSPAVAYVGAKFQQHLQRLAALDRIAKARDFYSGNFSIPRGVLLEIGLFDEEFTIYGNEDVELFVRLDKAGVRILFSAEAIAYQRYTKDFAGLARDNIAKGKTSVLLAHKYPQRIPELKLSTFDQASSRWHWLRSVLLAQIRRRPATLQRIVGLVELLGQKRSPGMSLIIHQTLDLCYWHGVETALRMEGAAGQPDTLPGALQVLQNTHQRAEQEAG